MDAEKLQNKQQLLKIIPSDLHLQSCMFKRFNVICQQINDSYKVKLHP